MKFDVALGTSVVVMAFDGERLVALIGEKSQEPYKGAPMLPSNWVSAGVSVEEVAKRMMNRILGVEKIYLEQLNAFAKVYRNPMGRVVNIAYFALLNWDVVKEVKTPGYKWVSLEASPCRYLLPLQVVCHQLYSQRR